MPASCAPNKLDPRIQRGTLSCTWHCLDLLARLRFFEKLLQFHHIIGKTIGAHWIAPQRQQGALICSRRSSSPRSILPG